MSEGFTLTFFLVALAISAIVELAADSAEGSKEGSQRKRHLIKQETQFTDRDLLNQTLDQLGFRVRKDLGELHWGRGQSIEVTVCDDQDRPWFALGREREDRTDQI